MAWARMTTSENERGELKGQQHALEGEKGDLALHTRAATIADHGAIGADHAVAGDDDGNGIAPAGRANIACRAAQGGRDLAIGLGAAPGNFQHGAPDLPVEIGSGWSERQFEILQPA